MVAYFDGAVDVIKETFAAESTNAVLSRLGGLLQPEVEEILFAKLMLTLSILFVCSAGLPRHLVSHPFPHLAPPCSSPRFAFLCSS